MRFQMVEFFLLVKNCSIYPIKHIWTVLSLETLTIYRKTFFHQCTNKNKLSEIPKY